MKSSEFGKAFDTDENSELRRLQQYLADLKIQAKTIETVNELRRQIGEEQKRIKELKGGFFTGWLNKRY